MAMGSIDSLSTRSLRSLVNLLISPNDFLMIYNPDLTGTHEHRCISTPLKRLSRRALVTVAHRAIRKPGPGLC